MKYTNSQSARDNSPSVHQIFWHTWSLAFEEYVASFQTLQDKPFAQSHLWKISSPWEPFLRCLVQTSPWWSTGLQILVQKWRAQQNPSMQSDDRRQGSPSCPTGKKKKRKRWIKGVTRVLGEKFLLYNQNHRKCFCLYCLPLIIKSLGFIPIC